MNGLRAAERLLFWFGIAFVAWAMLAFLVTPLLSSVHAAFVRDGSVAVVDIASELAGSRRVRSATWNTAWMTVATTVTVTIVGVFQVMVLEYYHVRGRSVLQVGFAVPLVFTSVVAAAGFNFTYGPGGVLTIFAQRLFPSLPDAWFHGWFGVLYAHTFLLTSFHFLFLRAAMRRVDFSTIEAARALGAGEFTVLARVVLPTVAPTLIAVTLLTVYKAAGSFSAPQILGGRDFGMLSQIILTLNSLRRQDMAALLALMLGGILMVLIVLSQHYENKGSFVGGSKSPVPIELRRLRNPAANLVLHACSYLLLAIYALPVFLVVLFSFAPAASIGVETVPSTLTLKNYAKVFSVGAALEPLVNSIRMGILAVGAGLAITLFAVPAMLRNKGWLARILDLGFFLPWVVPSILIAVGLIVSYDTPSWLIGNVVLLGSFWILPIGYAVFILPLMVRFLRAAFVSIDPSYEEAARSLGASALHRFRRVVLPLVLPTTVLVAGMTFNILMTEYPLSAFLYNVNNRPLPIAIVESAVGGDPEQDAISLVYATLIMGFSLAVILLSIRIGMGKGPRTGSI